MKFVSKSAKNCETSYMKLCGECNSALLSCALSSVCWSVCLIVNFTDLATSTSTCLLCLLGLLSQFCWFDFELWLVELVKAILLVVLNEAE